jgi:hypothetical protein
MSRTDVQRQLHRFVYVMYIIYVIRIFFQTYARNHNSEFIDVIFLFDHKLRIYWCYFSLCSQTENILMLFFSLFTNWEYIDVIFLFDHKQRIYWCYFSLWSQTENILMLFFSLIANWEYIDVIFLFVHKLRIYWWKITSINSQLRLRVYVWENIRVHNATGCTPLR